MRKGVISKCLIPSGTATRLLGLSRLLRLLRLSGFFCGLFSKKSPCLGASTAPHLRVKRRIQEDRCARGSRPLARGRRVASALRLIHTHVRRTHEASTAALVQGIDRIRLAANLINLSEPRDRRRQIVRVSTPAHAGKPTTRRESHSTGACNGRASVIRLIHHRIGGLGGEAAIWLIARTRTTSLFLAMAASTATLSTYALCLSARLSAARSHSNLRHYFYSSTASINP